MSGTQLGYPSSYRSPEPSALTSKLGGSAWWVTGSPQQQLHCECGRPLWLLCQVHAPITGQYERCLYVFVCDQTECSSSSDGWKVLRDCREDEASLLLTEPTTESPEPDMWDADDDEDVELDDLEELLKLREVRLEPDQGPKAPPPNGTKISGSVAMDLATYDESTSRWPSVELEWGEEPASLSLSEAEREHLDELQRNYEKEQAAAAEDPDAWSAEVYEKDNIAEDRRSFRRMIERVERSPMQCMRYCYGSEVLWLQPIDVDSTVSPCARCGAPREPELQLLPNTIYLLGDSQLSGGMDWGTAVVLTCSRSCASGGGPWFESVVVQG